VGEERLENVPAGVVDLAVGEAQRAHVLAQHVDAVRVLAAAALASHLNAARGRVR